MTLLTSIAFEKRSSLVIHATLSTSVGSLALAGVFGGLTVLVGVLVTEWLVRTRERQRRLDQALHDMEVASVPMFGPPKGATREETRRWYSQFLRAIYDLRREVGWPIRNAKAIREELDQIEIRLTLAAAKLRKGTTEEWPKLGEVMGKDIRRLVTDTRRPDSINDALRAEGFPTIDRWDDEDAWKPPEGPESR